MKTQKYSLTEKLKRIIKKQLIVPMLRLKLPPKVKALGVAVGLFWAMTPLVGIQMWLVFMTWLFYKKVFHKDFSLVLGIAWTWITNVFTMVPVYYIFYITGQILRGNFSSINGYANIATTIKEVFLKDMSFADKWVLIFKILLKDWGVSMGIGCIPWAIICSIIGYKLTLKYETYRLKKYQKTNKTTGF